jgi:hypothetical protein
MRWMPAHGQCLNTGSFRKVLTLMSLLVSGLLWNRFGDQLAIICYADASLRGTRARRLL